MCFSPDLSVPKQNSLVNMKVRTVRQVKQQRPRNRRFTGTYEPFMYGEILYLNQWTLKLNEKYYRYPGKVAVTFSTNVEQTISS